MMHPNLHAFIRQYVAVVCAALVPVILTTFLSMPMNLGVGAPDIHAAATVADRHMT